jgi:hypothetical protein
MCRVPITAMPLNMSERVGMMHSGITHQKLFVVRVGIHARQHDSNAATREHPQSVSLLLARPNQIAELFVERTIRVQTLR